MNPTQVFLTARTTSALLSLKNESDETLRFQLTAFGWDQSPQGEMMLVPTEDIVFFPALLELGAKEVRNVRIGIATPFGAVEKTYRIFVEELPPLTPSDPAAGVRVLTKMGVPIFLQPAKPQAQSGIRSASVSEGVLRFEVRNLGNVHFLPQSVRVRGLARTGEALFDKSMDGWYVLAGGARAYELKLPEGDCRAIAALSLEVQIGAATLKERLETSADACAP